MECHVIPITDEGSSLFWSIYHFIEPTIIRNSCEIHLQIVHRIKNEWEYDKDFVVGDPSNSQAINNSNEYFEEQLQLCESVKLPLFLHCRNAATDLVNILSRNRDRLNGGVVHSFDGSEQDAKSILELGYYIGINGCSLKTVENLQVVATIPSDRLMLETDCPWCEVRPTHAGAKFIKTTFPSVKKEKWQAGSMVKGRNEPTNIVQVLEIVAGVKDEDIEILSNTIYQNTMKLFFSS